MRRATSVHFRCRFCDNVRGGGARGRYAIPPHRTASRSGGRCPLTFDPETIFMRSLDPCATAAHLPVIIVFERRTASATSRPCDDIISPAAARTAPVASPGFPGGTPSPHIPVFLPSCPSPSSFVHRGQLIKSIILSN